MKQPTEKPYYNLRDEDFDIFIAYHGTTDEHGSLRKARDIFRLLSTYATCFFNPETNPSGRFSDTPIIASHSKLFLLVANSSVQLNRRHEITSPGLLNEIDAFYRAHFNDTTSAGTARVYAYDGLTAASAEKFHVVFHGAAHFSEEDSNDSTQNLVRWVQSALKEETIPVSSSTVFPPPSLARQSKHPYEGIWILSGKFTRFQGASAPHTSVGRLTLVWRDDMYKAVYCYSVSRAFQDSSVTAICEGGTVLERHITGEEQLVVTCNIIARTTAKKMRNSSMQFQLILTPQYENDGTILTMTSNFKTANTDGMLRFFRGG